MTTRDDQRDVIDPRTPEVSNLGLGARRARRFGKSVVVRRALSRASGMPSLPVRTSEDHRKPRRPPVFVLSAGWRSGSTAIQRLVISGGEAFVWGEPFPTSRVLPRLHRMLTEVNVVDAKPDRILSSEDLRPEASRVWLATTNPSADHLLAGARAMLEETYWGPLRQSSFATWGVKEVAATAEQIDMLVRAFPDARFVCVVRDPVEAYLSFRQFVVAGAAPSGRPDAQLTWARGPKAYAANWTRMAAAFRELEERSSARLFRYEDISGSSSFVDELSAFLEVPLDPSAWSARVGGVGEKRSTLMARMESSMIAKMTKTERKKWGYGDRRIG